VASSGGGVLVGQGVPLLESGAMATAALPELDAQYRALREAAGLLERPGVVQLSVRGSDAAEYLQSQVTNEVEELSPGEGCYALLLERKGHVVADMRILRLGENELLLLAEPAGASALERHLSTYSIGREVEIEPLAGRTMLSLIGPGSQQVAETSLAPEHAHVELLIGDVTCRAIATADGVDLIAGAAPRLTALLTERGAVEVSEKAAEIARVESGRPRLGAELGAETMPAEAGVVERAVSFTKGCYIGQEPVARLHYRGKPNRHLRGLRLDSPAAAGETLRLGEREVGRVGTACLSPALGPIALAIVRREAQVGATLAVGDARNSAVVTELPFRDRT
jgi:tRNA-modifying protein YgfZ